MNYQNELQNVTSQIETLTAQLNQLKKEQTILTQLVDMEAKMGELAQQLNTPTPQPTQTPQNITLTVVRDEVAVEVEEEKEEESFLDVKGEGHEVLENKKCRMVLNVDTKEIYGDDFTDPHNLPRCYSQTFRSYKKAWKALKELFTKDYTMDDCCGVLRAFSVRMHSYCSMD